MFFPRLELTESKHPCDVELDGCDHKCLREGKKAVCACYKGFTPDPLNKRKCVKSKMSFYVVG